MAIEDIVDGSPGNENPFVDSREDFDEPEAGWHRRRLLPDLPSPLQARPQVMMADASYDGVRPEYCTCCERGVMNQAIAVTEVMRLDQQLNDDCEKTWEEAFKDLVLNKLIDEQQYQNIIRYLNHLFEEACRLLKYCRRQQDRRMLIPSSEHYLPAYLVPDTLRILNALGYETESVDRVEAMDHVTLFVNGRMAILKMRKMCKLMRCMLWLSLVEARSMLMMTNARAGMFIELLQSAESGHVEEHYQPTLKLVWDSDDSDLLQSVGFSKRKKIYGKRCYKYTSSEKCRYRASVIFIVLQTFHRPANTLV